MNPDISTAHGIEHGYARIRDTEIASILNKMLIFERIITQKYVHTIYDFFSKTIE